MYVTEIYKTILGESSYAGMPCVIVRLAGCNLCCSYCDTLYSHKKGEERGVLEIVKEAEKFSCTTVTITGGEPLLQSDTILLAEKFLHEGFTVLLETNGSMSIKDVPSDVVRVVDIKCPDSRMDSMVNWENLKFLNSRDEIKFVLSSERDYKWAVSILNSYSLYKRCGVLFSPARDIVSPALLAEWILRDGINVRLQLQLHTIIGLK